MLETIYEQLVALLGKSPEQHLSMLLAIESELDEEAIIRPRDNEYKFYDLPQSGITLDFSGRKNIFVAFTLFLELGNDALDSATAAIFRMESVETIQNKF